MLSRMGCENKMIGDDWFSAFISSKLLVLLLSFLTLGIGGRFKVALKRTAVEQVGSDFSFSKRR